MESPEDHLFFPVRQIGRPLKHYTEVFVDLIQMVSWDDTKLNACFRLGMDDPWLRIATRKLVCLPRLPGFSKFCPPIHWLYFRS